MPRRTAITAAPTSPAAKRATLRPTAVAPPSTAPPVVSPVDAEPSSVTSNDGSPAPRKSTQRAAPAATKKIIRPPKYHETKLFLSRESAVPSDLPVPLHLGYRTSECYRTVATIHRAAVTQATMSVQPISWGYGSTDGTLGHNNTVNTVGVLKKVGLFRHAYLRQVAAGDKLSLFLTSDGRVLQSGRLFLHQDGHKMWKPRLVEFAVGGEGGDETESKHHAQQERVVIKAVEAGHLAAYALDEHGRVFSWGSRRYGQLGHGGEDIEQDELVSASGDGDNQERDNTAAEEDEEDDEDEAEAEDPSMPHKHLSRRDAVELNPRLIDCDLLRGIHVRQISAGNHFVLAVSHCGQVFSWGRNTHGQLGVGPLAQGEDSVSSPHRIDGIDDYIVLGVSAGHSHSLAVAIPRTATVAKYVGYSLVFAWGCGHRGRLGIGGEAAQPQPVEVTFFRGLHATQVAAGHDHSLVLCATGSTNMMYAFGGNAFGQLGIARDTMVYSDMPMCVEEVGGLTIAAVGAGAYTSAALTGDGEVYAWGDGSRGQTARTDKRTTFVPWKVTTEERSRFILQDSGFVTQLAVGAHHTLALYRTEGVPDRWRRFALGEVVHAVSEAEREDSNTSFQVVRCPSTHASATNSVFGIELHCNQCNLGPLCRVCVRRCHRGHQLVPRRLSDTLRVYDSEKSPIPCACGLRRPPPPQKGVKVATIVPGRDQSVAAEVDGGGFCMMAKAPETIVEE